MLTLFCARVALGLIACLLLLSPRQLHPRFFRTQFLTAFGLLVIATLTGWPHGGSWTRGSLAVSTILSLLGAISWTLDPAPGGRILIVATPVAIGVALVFAIPWPPPAPLIADNLTSAAFLGTALTTMLVGHSYLISPGMALTPLMRCLRAGGAALSFRIGIIGWGLWCWTEITPTYTLNNEVVLWLPVRWLVGVIAPLGFGWMAYSAGRIRSTQAATGILYVVVVCSFLGELLGLLLTRQTGLPL
jgi:hypothetical protein